MVWLQKETRDLATAWASTPGAKPELAGCNTSAHRLCAAVQWLMCVYPTHTHCCFNLGGFSSVILTRHQLLGLPIHSPFHEAGN